MRESNITLGGMGSANTKTRRMVYTGSLHDIICDTQCAYLLGSPARKAAQTKYAVRETGVQGREMQTQRSSATEEAYATFTNANETLRHVELFPCLVYGIGVFVRHRDSRVCHRRDGHTRDPPHTPSHRDAIL